MSEKKEILSSSDYPRQAAEKLRYADTDRQGHINNAVFSTLFESGRVSFLYDPTKPLTPEGSQFVIAELTIRFMGELNWPNEIVVGTGVSKVGRSSFSLTQGLFCQGECMATADSVMVLMDEKTRKSTALPELARGFFESLKM